MGTIYNNTENNVQPTISSPPLSKSYEVENLNEIELKSSSPNPLDGEGDTNYTIELSNSNHGVLDRNYIEPEVASKLLPSNNLNKTVDEQDFNLKSVDYPEGRFDINVYQQKKTLAQGMMDLALLSANANQLRYIFEQPEKTRGGFFYVSLTFIIMSLILQVTVGIGLIWNGRYDVKKIDDCPKANRANNFTVIGIFLITILNVFITAFGVPTTTTTVSVPVFQQQNYNLAIGEDDFEQLNDTAIK